MQGKSLFVSKISSMRPANAIMEEGGSLARYAGIQQNADPCFRLQHFI
jgi:hypothetical protein